ncbi:hypothetical protein PHYSODRAFT_326342 [Phytophthora sojae]|uniref:Uncharacterized protein n=1 Tax=Phytophthora sojae (strain P6497) TaxID=1094619 RepID=G4Z1F9_PHYSP|nr:hypothetical protein PHYSODRAFT_326342 [Phytophthora sojae]EGZ25307.1 hypothetical protein PHYSODRAFT_326342 [Phytophthora sojae]|eukprot:XP_009520595.1 hypothetical protein PHYSODRAFT_326342 [Phytophthora sojae]
MKMATGSQSAVPATPMKSGGTRGDDSTAVLITPQPDPIAESNDEEMDEEYDDYLEEKAPAPAVVTPETPEDAVMSAVRSGGSRSLTRSLASEVEDDAPPVTRNLADEPDDMNSPKRADYGPGAFEDSGKEELRVRAPKTPRDGGTDDSADPETTSDVSDGLPVGNDPEPGPLGPGRSSQVAPDDSPV